MGRLRSTHCQQSHLFKTQSNGKQWCPTCDAAAVERRRAANPEKWRQRQNKYMRDWRKANPNLAQAATRRQSLRWYDELATLKAAKGCRDCGETHPGALDFHHRDPAEKIHSISNFVRYASFERVMAEVAKCDILCCNCHRKHHYAEQHLPPQPR